MKADWIGLNYPDEFVVGYGIDYAQRDRTKPFIGNGPLHMNIAMADAMKTLGAKSALPVRVV